jgi:hypothetical protein
MERYLVGLPKTLNSAASNQLVGYCIFSCLCFETSSFAYISQTGTISVGTEYAPFRKAEYIQGETPQYNGTYRAFVNLQSDVIDLNSHSQQSLGKNEQGKRKDLVDYTRASVNLRVANFSPALNFGLMWGLKTSESHSESPNFVSQTSQIWGLFAKGHLKSILKYRMSFEFESVFDKPVELDDYQVKKSNQSLTQQLSVDFNAVPFIVPSIHTTCYFLNTRYINSMEDYSEKAGDHCFSGATLTAELMFLRAWVSFQKRLSLSGDFDRSAFARSVDARFPMESIDGILVGVSGKI